MSISDRITKAMENSRFCYAKDGGEGFVNKEECICTKEAPCQAIIDKERFHAKFKDMSTMDGAFNRSRIIEEAKPEFKDSQWWKDNVVE